MTTGRRLERDLPLILDELAVSPYPDYIDSVLTTTARRRQRPTWTFPERWIPMATFTARAATVPRTPLRAVAIVALLLVALAAGAALIIGTQRQVPPPFGRAATGLVAYAAEGDIYTVDPATGVSTAIITGPETDGDPRWSRDGTHLAFERKAVGDSGPGLVYVARADGSEAVRLDTAAPVSGIEGYYFSPDGTELLISYEGGLDAGHGYPSILIAATDGSGFRDLGMTMAAASAAWRPPDGSEILFMGVDSDGASSCCAIQAVNAKTGNARMILGLEQGRFRGHGQWSPNGAFISFGEWGDGDPDNGGLTAQPHVIAADGTGERILPAPPGTDWQSPESWSNDGTRLLVIRGVGPDHVGGRPAILPVDGHDTGIEIDWPSDMMSPTEPWAWEWAPDDSMILGTPADEEGANLEQVLLDPVAGTSRTLPWNSDSDDSAPSFQRLAP
jgi:Tol biopolymer transport system component